MNRGFFVSKLLFDDTINDTTNDTIKNRQSNIISLIISRTNPTLKGFDRRGLYRIMQFYVAYKDNEIVSTLLS